MITNPTRFQFSLRTLMAIVTLCAVVMAFLTTLGLDLVVGFSGFAWSCALVLVLASAFVPFDWAVSRLPFWTSFISIPILYVALAFAFFIFGEAIDQPHIDYTEGNWLTHGVTDAVAFFVPVGVAMLALIAIDGAVQESRPKDNAYYPRFANVWRGLRLRRVRLLLIIGALLVLGYYASTVIEVWSARQVCGLVWPPPRVYIACHLLWGLLWLADCASRPQRGTMAAAIGYICMAFLLPSGNMLRE